MLLHQQGVQPTSLADITQEAEIPPSNVYYHFRIKEALIDAVIRAHIGEPRAAFTRWKRDSDPGRRR